MHADRRRDRAASGTSSATRSATSSCRRRILGYFSLAYISRMTRSFMLEQLSQEYVTDGAGQGPVGARASSGATRCGNIMVPLVTVIALSYASLLEGAVLTETVFAWPGLGRYITRLAVQRRHERGARRHDRRRRGLHRPQPALRPPLPHPRPEDAMSARRATTRACAPGCWRDAPRSRWQARCGTLYRGWLALRAQSAGAWPGSSIVAALLLMATCRAAGSRRHRPIGQDLADRLLPPSRRALVRHRRARPRHLRAHRLWRARHALRSSSWSRSSSAPDRPR